MNRRQLRFLLESFGLSAPVSFNTFHVPLIDHGNNIFMAFHVIDVAEDSDISFIDQNLLLFWCQFIQKSNQKVDSASIY